MRSTSTYHALAFLAAATSGISNVAHVPAMRYTSKGRNTSPNTLHIQRPRFMTEEQKQWNAEVDAKKLAKKRALAIK